MDKMKNKLDWNNSMLDISEWTISELDDNSGKYPKWNSWGKKF